jgi:hypothetical protein
VDWPVDVMGSQIAQDWDALLGGLATILAWTGYLGLLTVAAGAVIAASGRVVWPHRFWCSRLS